MAKCIGAVRFDSGMLLYFIFNMFNDMARPRLFETVQAASEAWDDPQDREIDEHFSVKGTVRGEAVDLIFWIEAADDKTTFRTYVDRERMLIVGPLSHESAIAEGLG